MWSYYTFLNADHIFIKFTERGYNKLYSDALLQRKYIQLIVLLIVYYGKSAVHVH